MKISLFALGLINLLLVCPEISRAGINTNSSEATSEQARQWLKKQPVRFLENKGQMKDMSGKGVPFVLFKAELPGLNIFITEKGLTYSFLKFEEEKEEGFVEKKRNRKARIDRKEEEKEYSWKREDMELAGATIRKENIVKEQAHETQYNYYPAHYPTGIRDVRSYSLITIKDVYPGIDWKIYFTSDGKIKYDFVVHPGAKANNNTRTTSIRKVFL